MKKLLLVLLFVPLVSFGQIESVYYTSGASKYESKDYYGAIADYTKAIELNPNNPKTSAAYLNRGDAKYRLKDLDGAMADYNKAIELDPIYANAYHNRGISKENIGDLNGACFDWKKAISFGNSNSAEWVRNQCN